MGRDRVRAFLFWSDAWLADTIHLSLAEEGAFVRIIVQLHRHGGYLPDDPAYLCKCLRMTRDRWARSRAALIDDSNHAVLRVTPDGRIFSQRLLDEMDAATAKVEQCRHAAEARWGDTRQPIDDSLNDRRLDSNGLQITNPLEQSGTAGDEEKSTPTIPSGDADALRADMRSQCKKTGKDNKELSKRDIPAADASGDAEKPLPGFEKEDPEKKKRTSARRETWATPFVDAFEKRFGGKAPVGLIVRVAAPVRRDLIEVFGTVRGEREARMRWAAYLKEQQPARYNLHHFTEAHGEYEAKRVVARQRGGNGLDVEAAGAWEDVVYQLRKVGRMGDAKLTDRQSSALASFGGWDRLCSSMERELPELRRSFLRAYKTKA